MSNPSLSVLRRALLYVPSSSQKMLQKSLSLSTDTLCYDLEDSVTSSQKASARTALTSFLSSSRPPNAAEIAVRINDVSTNLALADLTELLQAPNIDTVVVPKVNSASDLHFITDVIRHVLPERHPSTPTEIREGQKPPLKILALIESARSLTDLREICAATPYLDGLVFAAEDFALDLSITRTPSLTEFLYARSSIVSHARAFNLPSAIDLVCTSFRGAEGLATMEEECAGGRRLGFNGKQCIHPSQVEVAQRAYGPAKEEVEWSVRVVIADQKAADVGRGAWTLQGKMIDRPVVEKARAVVERARACGWDLDAVTEEWKGQEPE